MRLIDADTLKPDYIVGSTSTNTDCYRYVSLKQIVNAPTADVVEVPGWIPVTERLPEEEADVLVTIHFHSDKELKKNGITEKYYVEVSSRIDDEWVGYSDEYKIRRHLHEVVAWMPLPDPWEGGAE